TSRTTPRISPHVYNTSCRTLRPNPSPLKENPEPQTRKKEERLTLASRPRVHFLIVQLANPVPLTVPAVTAAVEPSAMESVESSTAMHFAAGKPSADKALVSETSAAKAVAVEIAVEPALESARAVKAAAVKPVKPRACADKHATREPLRSIIAVRRAGVRVIVIVAVGAN